MSISLTHLALHVRDLDACVEFYQSYAGMRFVHQRISDGNRIVWLAEPSKESEFVLVILPGGPGRNQSSSDYSRIQNAPLKLRFPQDGLIIFACNKWNSLRNSK